MLSFLAGILSFIVIMGASSSFAQDIGISEIIYPEDTAISVQVLPNATLPNNIGFELIKHHLILAKILGSGDPVDDALDTIQNLENLVKTDIIEAMIFTNDRRATLTEYLAACEISLEKGKSNILSLQQEMALIKLELNACQADKDIADKDYFQGVNDYDDKGSQQALTQSIENEKCISEKRIQYNSKVYLLDKLVFFQSLLQQRYDVIVNDQELIIDHFEVISDRLIDKLNTINEVLKTYSF